MTEQLTGYEASSVAEIEAILDAMPADADQVYLDTIGYSERAIAAVAAKRAGGGGSAPFVALGPYDLAYTDFPGGFDYVKVVDFADGTIIWRVAVICTHVFSSSGENVILEIGPTGGTPLGNTTVSRVALEGADIGPWDAAEPVALESHLTWGIAPLPDPPLPRMSVAQHSVSLFASLSEGGNDQGTLAIYALVSVPT